MSKEQYVTFEVAKLLKEKGFDWPCRAYWHEDNKELIESQSQYHLRNITNPCWFGNTAPTQQMACRWLREEHKIDISVTPDDGSWWIKVTELEYWSGVFDGKVLNSDDIKYAYEGDTSTKEGCYEAGLEYVLKNLI
jgi:hypothetical protein